MSNENNIIELLKQALLFYSNVNNYKVDRKVSDQIFSLIEMDLGTQARFALKLIEDNAKVMGDANEEYMNSIIKNVDDNNVDMIEIINVIKKLNDDN